ncbi:hypothetical protein E2320_006443 [Naja naja]|nr:hypothetical protein E2320_006443 [Naja naja]
MFLWALQRKKENEEKRKKKQESKKMSPAQVLLALSCDVTYTMRHVLHHLGRQKTELSACNVDGQNGRKMESKNKHDLRLEWNFTQSVKTSEQVVIQAYGYTQEFLVTISIKSYPDKITTYAFGTIQLTAANHFQGSVALTVQPKDLRTNDPQKRVESIYLEAMSPHFTRQKKMLLTYDNGFLFIQTDKPIYTPDQSVKVRAYSLNEELRPARRAAVLTFVDPDEVEVDIIHEEDATGIVSFPEFKIPPYPKFGIWTIKAKYDKEFTTSAIAKFQMEDGVGMLYFNSQIAIRELGYSELSDVDGATLYIAASVLETGDGHTEDAELTTVKFSLSPYKLDLIATPLFVKPGLPYFIKARVRDMLDVSVGNVPVVLQATALTDQLKETRLVEEGSDSGSGITSSRDGTTIFTVNIPSDTKALEFKVGEIVQLKVYPASHYIEKILHYSYLILSKGKIIKYGTKEKIQGLSYQGLTFQITKEMVPSARLLVYYIVTGEGTAELVADSIWLNIQQKCGNNLELRILENGRVYQPGEAVPLSMTSELDSLVALSAMDKAIYGVTGSKQKSMEKALLQLEKSDLGCGAGGGENNVDVFRMAGLTFLTNANADDPREKVAQFQNQQIQKCCRMGAELYPFPQTCQQRIKRIKAFNALLDMTPQVRSFFPESWLWEVHPVQRSKNLPVTLPDSLTTWEIQGVSISDKGICVADTLEVEVIKDVFVDVHIPYSVVRGEQIELKATIYNYGQSTSRFCLKISVQKGICLFGAAKTLKDGSQANTCSHPKDIQSSSIMVETFKVLPLELGLLSVNLTLFSGLDKDILLKTLRVVKEFSYMVPRYIVPKTQLVKTLSIKGNLLGDVIQAAVKPEALKLLADLPQGSAERELMNIIPVFYVYDYLERTNSWDIFGSDRTSAEITLLRKMKRGIISVLSFQKQDFSYSMWKDAFILKVFGQVRRYMPDQFGTACTSLTWLIDICQMDDGSFREVSDYKPVVLQGALRDQDRENRLYLTAFTLIAFSEYKKMCPFQKFADAENRAVGYLLQNIAHSQNTFVLAIVTYALTQAKANHPDLHSAFLRLKNEAQVKGNPPAYRFWKETPIKLDASIPSEGNARMVETTGYTLLSILLKGDHDYAKPVMKWLTEEQRFGGGFYSTQDTIIALQCLTEYSILIKRLTLDLNVKASYKFQGDFHTYRLTSSNYIGRPVDLRSVYYVSSISEDTCDFQLKVDVTLDEKKYYLSFNEVRLLFACANVDQMISNYEITPDGHVVMQVDSIPGNEFLCVGFRTTEIYRVGMSRPGTFSVYDYHDPDKKCTIFYNAYGEDSLVKLCEGSECKCMEAECGHMQPQLDMSITLDTRKEAACQENIAYVYKVVIKSSKEEGSFVKYHAYPLDDSTWIEWWPSPNTACGSCQAFTESLDEFVDDLFLSGC